MNYEQENFGEKEKKIVPLKKKNNFSNFNIKSKKNIIPLLIVVVLIVIILVIIFFPSNKLKSSKDGLTISLLEDDILKVGFGANYIDPGYIAYDEEEGDITNNVEVKGNVDIMTPGEYEVDYYITNSKGTTVEITRKIIVQEPKVSTDSDLGYSKNSERTLLLSLIGDDVISMTKGARYVEKGYIAYDSIDGDVADKVKVKSSLDTSKLGMHTINYSITYGGTTKSVNRIVIVKDSSQNTNDDLIVNIELSTEKDTNSAVTIKILITGNNYKYTLTPDNGKIYKDKIYYVANTNGEYQFTVFDMNNNSKDYKVNISNIDKVKPFATCNGKVDNDQTNLIIESSDNGSGISHYSYNGAKFNSNTYTINAAIREVNVNVYDHANNYTSVSCDIVGYKVYNPLRVGDNSNSSEYIPCNSNWSRHNQELQKRIQYAGKRTRDGAVAAAVYLSTYFEYRIPYFYAGGHYHYSWDKGDNILGISSQWGCMTKINAGGISSQPSGSLQLAGMDCTGFIAWVLRNAGWSENEVGSFSGGSTEPDKKIWNGELVEIIDLKQSAGRIQAGDIVWQSGHMGFVIEVNGNKVRIAESIFQGLTVKEHDIENTSFEKVLLMDPFYNKG